MGHHSYSSPEEQRAADKKIGTTGFWILLAVTLGEVFIALLGNGHLIEGFTITKWFMGPLMIGASLFKAYYIVSIFMHLGSEVGGFGLTVVMPMALLIWGVIAFLWEGDHARHNRNYVKNARPGAETNVAPSDKATGMLLKPEELPSQLSFK